MTTSDAVEMSRPSTRRLLVLMILVTIAAIVLLLVCAEVAVRVRQHIKYGSTATLEEQFIVDP